MNRRVYQYESQATQKMTYLIGPPQYVII